MQEPWRFVDPTSESTFPGIHQLRSTLEHWQWVYGHTPKFQVHRTFVCYVNQTDVKISVDLSVDHGRIASASFEVDGCRQQDLPVITGVCRRSEATLNGRRFWPSEMDLNVPATNCEWMRSFDECLKRVAFGKWFPSHVTTCLQSLGICKKFWEWCSFSRLSSHYGILAINQILNSRSHIDYHSWSSEKWQSLEQRQWTLTFFYIY